MACVLRTPLTDVLEMEWSEVLLWHDEAVRISKVTGGA
ncbi:hypothetical protein W911_06890 [Hyphomicrobium nitrativorans NL23]|uniref:Uncharacterized protein n=1 Tax=Hyphomicrobium nitrativorans NL23 TaxID=1029756 RepID=V5SGR7_9HYPH|nr:hypothetical protein W911_06890 [Hyphomicrobium nitrativorans NL23]